MRRRSDSLQANLCQAQHRDLKTIAPLWHRPIVLTDTIDYRTIVFCTIVHNPSVCVCVCSVRPWRARSRWSAARARTDASRQEHSHLWSSTVEVALSTAHVTPFIIAHSSHNDHVQFLPAQSFQCC